MELIFTMNSVTLSTHPGGTPFSRRKLSDSCSQPYLKSAILEEVHDAIERFSSDAHVHDIPKDAMPPRRVIGFFKFKEYGKAELPIYECLMDGCFKAYKMVYGKSRRAETTLKLLKRLIFSKM